MARNDEPKAEGEAVVVEAADGPLLDLTDAAVKRMIKIAKKRGWVTQDELNAVLPSEEISSDQIEDMNAMLSEMGINVVEAEDAEEAEKETPRGRRGRGARRRRTRRGAARDRGRDAQLRARRAHRRSRAHVFARDGLGRVALARGRNRHRQAHRGRPRGDDRGLCESPLTFQAIIIWRDELNEAKILLRDIIDLEATYAGPDGKKTPKVDMTAPGAAEALAAQIRERDRALDRAADPARRLRRRSRRRRPKASTTKTIWRIPSRSRRWKPSSSRKCSRPSTASPTPTRSCAGCRTRTSRTSSRTRRCRPRRSANTRR